MYTKQLNIQRISFYFLRIHMSYYLININICGCLSGGSSYKLVPALKSSRVTEEKVNYGRGGSFQL